MRFQMSYLVLMAIFVFATAAPNPPAINHHDEEATSYSIITKHESKHGDHDGHTENYKLEEHTENKDNKVEENKELHVEFHHNSVDHKEQHEDEHHSYPKYKFKYGVKDTKSGDIKEQWESRDGDKVEGGYALKEADGTTRIVKYTSDKETGFVATVHNIGHVDQKDEKEEKHEHQSKDDKEEEKHSDHYSHGSANSYVVVQQY